MTAFVGTPHRMDGRSSQVFKSLAEIGFENYLQAALEGWALYLEGSTDLSVLRAFARRLDHPAIMALERPFVHYVGNQPMQARRHFYGLKEACPELRGYALFDHLNLPDGGSDVLAEHSWEKREIENYLYSRDSLMRWVQDELPLFAHIMGDAISEVENARRVLGQSSPWDGHARVSDEFLSPLFRSFYEKTGMSGLISKSDYHFLVAYLEPAEIDAEVVDVLDAIANMASEAGRLVGQN